MMRHGEYQRNKESISHKKKANWLAVIIFHLIFTLFSRVHNPLKKYTRNSRHKFWKENKMRNVFLLNSPKTEGEKQTGSPENSHLMHYKKTSSLPIQYKRYILYICKPEKFVFSAKTCIRSYHYFKTRV